MTPDKMTNAELADALKATFCTSNAEYYEAIKRLRAMPESTKPEFCVGWRGDCKCDTAAIHGIDHETGLLYGQAGEEACCWRSDGSAVTNGTGYDLIPNTKEPEIWWRRTSKPDQLYSGISAHDMLSGNFEKVSVQVAK